MRAVDMAQEITASVLSFTGIPPLTVVYSGGGPFGIAYGLGIAHALIAAGVPLQEVDALGTSSGAWVASCVATGVGREVLCEVPPVRVPNPIPGWIRRTARSVFGEAHDERVRIAAVGVPTLRRQILSGGRFPLADLVAASSSLPGLFPPSPVGHGLYVDGAVRSQASVDQAPAARNLLVIAPVAGPVLGAGGRIIEQLLTREMRRWTKATGGTVHLIRPDSAISRLVRHPLDLFDQRRAHDVYPMAFAQAAQLLQTRPALARLTRPVGAPLAA
ncbi:patatin-like phospholipase family protein [Frankia sp. Cr1]|uniref:patatin-like phospholipase family protein n=1 Tax=Frankia sp. Cr1 TaxID=3073931 RepID=UPI002AD535EC|nr:patatin-like phospholipase family protein [Frankia sp. Cr1]